MICQYHQSTTTCSGGIYHDTYTAGIANVYVH